MAKTPTPPPKFTCGGCPVQWTAKSWAHCAVCHSMFTGVTYFDYHRIDGECWGTGRVEIPRHTELRLEDGVWSTPAGHQERLVMKARASAMRKARGKSGSKPDVLESVPGTAASDQASEGS